MLSRSEKVQIYKPNIHVAENHVTKYIVGSFWWYLSTNDIVYSIYPFYYQESIGQGWTMHKPMTDG